MAYLDRLARCRLRYLLTRLDILGLPHFLLHKICFFGDRSSNFHHMLLDSHSIQPILSTLNKFSVFDQLVIILS